MCKSATSQVSNLMTAVRPALVGLMADFNVPKETQMETLAAFDAAQEQLANWVPGTTTTSIIQALNAAMSVVNALSAIIPSEALGPLNLIVGALEAVITIVMGNSTQDKAEQAKITDEGIAKVQKSAPEFKLGFLDRARAELGVDDHIAANHFKHQWNKSVAALGPDHAHLKQ